MPGVFDELLDLDQELDRLAAVHDPVIVGECDIHHWPDRRLPVYRDDAILDLVEPEDAHLRRIENRRAEQRAEDAAVRDRKRPAFEILEGQGAVGGALREFTTRQLELRERLSV